MKNQDKNVEIDLMRRELVSGAWDDSEAQVVCRKKALKLLEPELNERQLILDAGCGPGTYGLLLASQGKNVIGIDISAAAAGVAQKRATAQDVDFKPMAGDLERLPLKDKSVDVCFCAFVLHHLPDIDRTVKEFARVLNENGKIIIMEPNGSNPGVKLSGIIEGRASNTCTQLGVDTSNETIHNHKYYVQLLKQNGFKDIKVTSYYFGGLPPLPDKHESHNFKLQIIRFMVQVRRIMYVVLYRILPQPFNGADLLVIGTNASSRQDG
ncbi:MAG: class I SAM-dependent methyltransferase [Dehalococcoidales bacterium]|nr:class I SAM-dependent methyltransferase [Dehalococcoidales bacterium]